MKIVKYRKGRNGKYKIELDNGNTISLYEEVILKFNLLINKEIDEDVLIELDKYNQECDVYYVALNSLKSRFKSIHDTRMFLLKKEYPEDLVEKAIDKLVSQGYLNDKSFTKSYINSQLLTTNKGPYKIKRELRDKGVDDSIIEEEMELFTEGEQLSKIDKLIKKGIKSNHNKGGDVLKQKIYSDVKNLGYDIFLINRVISNYTFDNNVDIAKREYLKLYKKYSKKYSGSELKNVIKNKLYQKGLKYEDE